MAFDLSDIGGVPVAPQSAPASFDLSDIGGKPVQQNQSPANSSVSPVMALAAGINAGGDKVGLGIQQLFHLANPDSLSRAYQADQADLAEATKSHPNYAKTGNFIGGLAASSPFMAIPGVGEGAAGALTQGAIQGGLTGGAQYVAPGQSRLLNTLTGAGTGMVLNPLARGLASPNPYVKSATGIGLGGAVGYEAGDSKTSALEGGAAGLALALAPQAAASYVAPYVNKLVGLTGLPYRMSTQTPIQDMAVINQLDGVDPVQAKAALDSAKRLGLTYLTPADVTGSPVQGAAQGKVMSSKAGGPIMFNQGQQRLASEKQAIENLFQTIAPDSYDDGVKQSFQQKVVTPLYEKSYQDSVEPADLDDLLSNDKILQNAYTAIGKDPVYSNDLKDVAPENIKYLDYVKKYLDDQANTAYNAGEKNRSNLISDSKDNLVQLMDNASDTYAQARAAAQRNIARNELSKTMNNADISGSNFYEKALKNDDQYQNFYNSLSKVPEAQQQLADMRVAFKNLVDPTTAAQAAKAYGNEVGSGMKRDDLLKNVASQLFSGGLDRAQAELITNPAWAEQLSNVAKMKNKAQSAVNFYNLLGKAGMVSAVNTAGSLR